ADLLARARTLASKQGWNNIEFILGDTTAAIERGLKVDASVMNMVLHHVPAPADLFEDCYQLLEDGGALVVTDLGRHDQTWVKDSCGDLWLGFDPADLTAWAEEAGFSEGTSLYVGVRSRFQLSIRQILKQERQYYPALVPASSASGARSEKTVRLDKEQDAFNRRGFCKAPFEVATAPESSAHCQLSELFRGLRMMLNL